MIGPGKYDDLCTHVVEQTGIAKRGGGVILVVVGGDRGSGFSCQADLATTLIVPDMLEHIAQQIRQDWGG
jgi:hypothetical protein